MKALVSFRNIIVCESEQYNVLFHNSLVWSQNGRLGEVEPMAHISTLAGIDNPSHGLGTDI